jgi:hypothetical protein
MLIALVGIVLVALVAGCGGEPEDTSSGPEVSQGGQAENGMETAGATTQGDELPPPEGWQPDGE